MKGYTKIELTSWFLLYANVYRYYIVTVHHEVNLRVPIFDISINYNK